MNARPRRAWWHRALTALLEPSTVYGDQSQLRRASTVNLVLLTTVLLGTLHFVRLLMGPDGEAAFTRVIGAVLLVDFAIYLVSRAGAFRLAVGIWLVWVPVSLFLPLAQAPAQQHGFIFLVSMAYLILGPGVAGLVLRPAWALAVGLVYAAVPFVAAHLVHLPVRYPAATVGFFMVGTALLALHHRVLRATESISEVRRQERDEATRRTALANEALAGKNAELQETSARLERRTRALETANRELAAFSHAAAHELRGPTRTVAGFAELLRDDLGTALVGDPHDHLQRVCRAASRLSLILDGMQAHVDLSTRYPEAEPVEVAPLLAQVVADCELPTHVDVMFGGDSPVIDTDAALLATALRQLLRHIISRAPAELDGLRLTAHGVHGGCSIVIDPVEALRPFAADVYREHRTDPFHRLVPSTEGMGLVSARKAVARLGGMLLPLADRGAGQGFRLELPPTAPADPEDTFVG